MLTADGGNVCEIAKIKCVYFVKKNTYFNEISKFYNFFDVKKYIINL